MSLYKTREIIKAQIKEYLNRIQTNNGVPGSHITHALHDQYSDLGKSRLPWPTFPEGPVHVGVVGGG